MKKYVLLVLMLGLFAIPAYCQDNQPTDSQDQAQAVTAAAAPAPATTESVTQPQEISIYGEVKAVNPAASSMTVQYYDYDSDEEKSIEIVANGTTKMENAATINDIKQGNWADVIYTVTGGKNLAKSVIVEKEEEAPAAEMPKAEEKTAPAMPAELPKQQ